MKQKKLKPTTAVLVLAAALCLGILMPGSAVAQKKGKAYPTKEEAARMESAILSLVNDYRKKQGKAPLTGEEAADRSAREHSRNMAAGEVAFGHDGFDERVGGLMKRMKATGGAENVAYSPFNARAVVQGWINSPGHRKNMLGDYNIAGIGIASGKDGYRYFTMIYLKKKS